MVADKMYSRSTGRLQNLIKQPAAGRANQGGLRIGEMERDAIISHGTMNFLKESLLDRSDKYSMIINELTGEPDYTNNDNRKQIILPYASKMLLQELQTMCISSKILTPTQISNIKLFETLYNTLDNNNIDESTYEEEVNESNN
tara:strand:- start:98 stop:529 length:432 start_codon:yes stop_codon:yes gene_type:complete